MKCWHLTAPLPNLSGSPVKGSKIYQYIRIYWLVATVLDYLQLCQICHYRLNLPNLGLWSSRTKEHQRQEQHKGWEAPALISVELGHSQGAAAPAKKSPVAAEQPPMAAGLG